MTEDDLIAAVMDAAAVLPDRDVRLGIGDDAAILALDGGSDLVACTDTLNLDTHFLASQPPESIGHRCLAANLSDLAAMGAAPRFALLSLSMPAPDAAWLEEFLGGFGALARRHDVALVGGDTTRGPLAVAVTALGSVAPGTALTRKTAKAGDRIWVSGSLGGAALALADPDAPQERLLYPEPRVNLGQALIGVATAAMDLSDGLRVDLPRLLGRHGGRIDADRLPLAGALRGRSEDWRLAVCGGDDYELCFTAPVAADTAVSEAAAAAATAVTAVGMVTDEAGCILASDGRDIDLGTLTGFEHFS
ncbi:MAG: thiamine-phosphate kinase [Pseudomonadota bacterium]